MAKLLHIVASPRSESYSTRLAKAFDTYRQARSEDSIETLDVFRDNLPPFTCRWRRPSTR